MKARPRTLLVPFALLLALSTVAAQAQEQGSTASDPLFLGYGTEPGMDYSSRTVASAQSLIARAISSIGDVGTRHPGLTPAWEIPVAVGLILVQHEVAGHGGRGREFGLSPSYRFGLDFSASTSLGRAPRTNEQGSLLAAGGTEADGVMAHRLLLDSMRPEGIDGAKLPLALLAKLDLTLYVAQTNKPSLSNTIDLVDQYREGNDMAFYLVSRQATRRAASPSDVWEGTYNPDFSDRLLVDNFDDMRATALWNLLDPALAGAVYAYFHDHVRGGEARARALMWRPAPGLGLSLGTRGALGPQEVSRFLDLHAAGRWGVATVYARDLDSSADRTYGYGASLHGLKLGENVVLGVSVDSWKEPAAEEGLRSGDGWNANAELEVRFRRVGLAVQGGAKSEGFYPGLPIADGAYVGFGVTYQVDFAPDSAP